MPTFAKAIAAFLATALAGLGVILSGPAPSFGDISAAQWVALAAGALASANAVYLTPNGVVKK